MQKLEALGNITWEKNQTETGSKKGRKEAKVRKKPGEEKNPGEENKNKAHIFRLNNLEQLAGFILTIMMITLTNINQ